MQGKGRGDFPGEVIVNDVPNLCQKSRSICCMGICNRKAHLSLGKGREESLRKGFLGCVLKAVF